LRIPYPAHLRKLVLLSDFGCVEWHRLFPDEYQRGLESGAEKVSLYVARSTTMQPQGRGRLVHEALRTVESIIAVRPSPGFDQVITESSRITLQGYGAWGSRECLALMLCYTTYSRDSCRISTCCFCPQCPHLILKPDSIIGEISPDLYADASSI
jgi:hypothetical protein